MRKVSVVASEKLHQIHADFSPLIGYVIRTNHFLYRLTHRLRAGLSLWWVFALSVNSKTRLCLC